MSQAKPLTLLVVDDHAEFRRTVRQVFEGRNVEVVEAASAEEALGLYAARRTDWVIMDLRMPGMGGIKATEALRRLDPTARVIVISQFFDPEFRERARQAGAVDFFSKEDVLRLAERIQPAPPKPGKDFSA